MRFLFFYSLINVSFQTLSSSRLARLTPDSLGSCHWSFCPLFLRLLFRGRVWWPPPPPPLGMGHMAPAGSRLGGPWGGVVDLLGKLLNDVELPGCDIRSGWWSDEEMNSRTGWLGRWSVGDGRSANSGGGRWGWAVVDMPWPLLNVLGPFWHGLWPDEPWKDQFSFN